MSAFDDAVDVGLNLGAMALSQQIGKNAENSLAQAIEKKDLLGILFSAGVYGASMYVYQSSARKVGRIVGKYQTPSPRYYLPSSKSRKTPIWRLPKKNRKSTKTLRF